MISEWIVFASPSRFFNSDSRGGSASRPAVRAVASPMISRDESEEAKGEGKAKGEGEGGRELFARARAPLPCIHVTRDR